MKEIFEKNVNPVSYNEKVDTSVFKERTTAKSFRGYLIGLMKKAKNEENIEILYLLDELYKKYMEYETKAKVTLKGWKGKSSFQVIKKPDYFIVITYQKADQDSTPTEIKKEVTKKEVNLVLEAIYNTLNSLEKGATTKERVSSKQIAEQYCILSNMKENTKEKALFDNTGFRYDLFFSDRFLHTHLNIILRLLDYLGIINYRGKYVQLLKSKVNIQIELN